MNVRWLTPVHMRRSRPCCWLNWTLYVSVTGTSCSTWFEDCAAEAGFGIGAHATARAYDGGLAAGGGSLRLLIDFSQHTSYL